MAELTEKETLDDVLMVYKRFVDPTDKTPEWIDEQRLRIIRALEYESERRAEVFKKIAEGLLKSLDIEDNI